MLTGFKQLSSQEINRTSTSKVARLGDVAMTRDGRIYRYSQAGAVALSAGKLTTSPAKVANHTAQAIQTAFVVGDKVVNVTTGATILTADQYADGYLAVVDASGVGQTLSVNGNSAVGSGGGTATVYLDDAVVTAATTSGKYSLVYNPWAATIISAGAVALFANGVPGTDVAVSAYYWSQTGGMASVLSDGVIGKASGAIISDAVNGAVEVEVAATVTQRVGTAPEATVDAKYYPLYLTIDR